MRNSRLDIQLLSGAGGAEVLGVDVSQDLDDGTVGEIRDALNEHCVVFFRDQELDVAQHKAFARRFGEIFIHPNYKGTGDDPEIVMVRREPGDTGYVGEDWHADTTMVAEPPQAGKNKGRSTKHRDGPDWRETISVHPVVRTHPETKRKLLFVNASYTIGFEDMTEAESKPLLDFLMEHGNRPEFTFRFRWQKGSLAFWDNRSAKHIALGDTGPFRRLMRRIQICGDKPV